METTREKTPIKRPIVFITSFAIILIALCADGHYIIAFIASAAFIFYALKVKKNSLWVILACTIIALIITFQFSLINYHANSLNDLLPYSGNITAQLISYPKFDGEKTTAVFKINSFNKPKADSFTHEKIFVTFYSGETLDLTVGNHYSFDAAIKKPSPAKNPHGFDYQRYLKSEGIYYLASAKAETVTASTEKPVPLTYRLINPIRNSIENTLKFNMEQKEASFSISVLLGDTYSDEESLEDIRTIGVAHILSVSGLHVAIIFVNVNFVLSALKIKKLPRFIAVSALLLLYTAITGYQVSVIRAALMMWTAALGGLFKRKPDMLTSLSLAALIVIVLNPYAIYGVSFQLSFGAVLGIALFMPMMQKKINAVKNKALKWLLGMTAMTVCAQIFTAPLTAQYFNTVSPVSLIANCVVVPLINLVLILNILACALFFIPLAPYAILSVSSAIIDFSFIASSFMANFPYASIYIRGVKSYFYFLYSAVVLLVSGYAVKWKKLGKTAASLLLCAFIFFYAFEKLQTVPTSVSFIDVGMGDCTVIRSGNEVAVIDTGGGYLNRNTAENILLPYFFGENIDRINALILTHSDADHMQGALGLIGRIPIDKIYANDDGGILYKVLCSLAEDYGIPVYAALQGDVISAGGVNLSVLSPAKEMLGATSENDSSIIISSVIDSVSFLFLADMGKEAEEFIINNNEGFIKYDYIKTAHHGSMSDNEHFYLFFRPKTAIISVGTNNYNLPSQRLLDFLELTGSRCLRTDESGCITVEITRGKDAVTEYVK